MRAIIRCSINGEADSRLRNHLASLLQNAGFARVGTGSWENANISMPQLAAVMGQFWTAGANPQASANAVPGVALDHIWVYTDEPAV